MGPLAFAIEALQAAPSIAAAGLNLAEFVQRQTITLIAMQAENRDPSEAEWATLRVVIANDTAALTEAAKPDAG